MSVYSSLLLLALTAAAGGGTDPHAVPMHVRTVDATDFSDAISPEIRARIDFEAARNIAALRRRGHRKRWLCNVEKT